MHSHSPAACLAPLEREMETARHERHMTRRVWAQSRLSILFVSAVGLVHFLESALR